MPALIHFNPTLISTLTFWPRGEYAECMPWTISIDFGADSSNHFPFKACQTNRHLNRQAHMEWSSSMPAAAAVQWAWIINVSWHNGIGTGSSQDWTENQSEFITFAVGLCLNSNNFLSITSQLLKSHPHSTNVNCLTYTCTLEKVS